jgi:hypothetical protein
MITKIFNPAKLKYLKTVALFSLIIRIRKQVNI